MSANGAAGAASPEVRILGARAHRIGSIEEVMVTIGAQPNEPMSRHTTLHIGGPADWYLEAETIDDIAVARILARSRELPVVLIGNGSNILVGDLGIRGLVIKPSAGLATITDIGTGLLQVGAGVRLPELARYFREEGVGGMEWGFGVPGCVGGGIFMNAGTRDGEMKDVVESVIIVGRGGRAEELPAAECGFAYRTSRFQRTGEIIGGAIVRLPDKPYDPEKARRALDDRKKSQPLQMPNCGSVFTNPPGDYAARLMEECGLKGRTVGGAQISKLHANFIVNLGNATARDVCALMDIAAREVKQKFDIDLHSEVRKVGEFS
ncbi:MAG: UDP-N-acetylmuramate dehydrogenase [Candidatus Hydrogenedentota bacterium]